MFASIGEITPPCGVPVTRCRTLPVSSRTPALSHLRATAQTLRHGRGYPQKRACCQSCRSCCHPSKPTNRNPITISAVACFRTYATPWRPPGSPPLLGRAAALLSNRALFSTTGHLICTPGSETPCRGILFAQLTFRAVPPKPHFS